MLSASLRTMLEPVAERSVRPRSPSVRSAGPLQRPALFWSRAGYSESTVRPSSCREAVRFFHAGAAAQRYSIATAKKSSHSVALPSEPKEVIPDRSRDRGFWLNCSFCKPAAIRLGKASSGLNGPFLRLAQVPDRKFLGGCRSKIWIDLLCNHQRHERRCGSSLERAGNSGLISWARAS